LNDERDNYTRLHTENTTLSQIKSDNETKLNRLNHMVEPIEHEVVFKENQKPDTIQKYISGHQGATNKTIFENKDGKRH
jgi:hypothetical protein